MGGDEAGFYIHSRVGGEEGFAVEEVNESRRSKLLPYGLLSSSFHMMQVALSRHAFWGLWSFKHRGFSREIFAHYSVASECIDNEQSRAESEVQGRSVGGGANRPEPPNRGWLLKLELWG